MRKLLREMGSRYEHCRVDNFVVTCPEQERAIQAIKGYGDSIEDRVKAGANLLLIGSVGVGKDHLIAGLCKLAVKRRISIRYTTGLALYRRFRDVVRNSENEDDAIEEYLSPSVLAISDPIPPKGVELTDWEVKVLLGIVDGRYRAQKSIWVTTNLPPEPDEAVKYMAAPILDRLRDGATVIKCDWASYRKAVAK